MEPKDLEEIKRLMTLPDDDNIITKDSLVYSDDRMELRFGVEDGKG